MGKNELWTQKYAPHRLADLIGNDEQIAKVRHWILNWLKGISKKPLLLYGAVGVGKTGIAYVLRDEFQLDLVEMGANELRNKDRIERVLTNATLADSLSGNKKLFLVDDADAFQRSDAGGIPAIAKLLRDSSKPVIITATNAWDRKISAIRTECELIEFKKVSKTSIKSLINKIAEAEKLQIGDEEIDHISEGSNGDVRSAINDLQARISSNRDREKDIFETVRTILKATTYSDAKKVVSGDVDYNIIKLWIDENIPAEYSDISDIAAAYNYLSRADQFEGRIRNSYWGYLRYTIDLMSAGVALAKKSQYRKFTRYSFPNYLREMASTVGKRAMLKSIGKKIGEIVHSNSKDALTFMPLLKDFGEKYLEDTISFYHFTEDEMAFIMETSAENLKNGNARKTIV